MEKKLTLQRLFCQGGRTVGFLFDEESDFKLFTVERDTLQGEPKAGQQFIHYCLPLDEYRLKINAQPDLSYKVKIAVQGYMRHAAFESERDPYKMKPGSVGVFSDATAFMNLQYDKEALKRLSEYATRLYMQGFWQGKNWVTLEVTEAEGFEMLKRKADFMDRMVQLME